MFAHNKSTFPHCVGTFSPMSLQKGASHTRTISLKDFQSTRETHGWAFGAIFRCFNASNNSGTRPSSPGIFTRKERFKMLRKHVYSILGNGRTIWELYRSSIVTDLCFPAIFQSSFFLTWQPITYQESETVSDRDTAIRPFLVSVTVGTNFQI